MERQQREGPFQWLGGDSSSGTGPGGKSIDSARFG